MLLTGDKIDEKNWKIKIKIRSEMMNHKVVIF